jgi:hypothetical protein
VRWLFVAVTATFVTYWCRCLILCWQISGIVTLLEFKPRNHQNMANENQLKVEATVCWRGYTEQSRYSKISSQITDELLILQNAERSVSSDQTLARSCEQISDSLFAPDIILFFCSEHQ